MSPLQLCLDLVCGALRAPFAAPSPPARPRAAEAVPATPPGQVRFELRRSSRRRTLGLEVHPDLRVVVRAPARMAAVEIELFLAERAAWIEAQLAHFRAQPARAATAAFGDGCPVRHLGVCYRVSLRPDGVPGILIDGGELVIGGVAAALSETAHQAYAGWSRAQAAVEFTTLLDTWHAHPRFARYPRPPLAIRAMRTRWGSLGTRRGMSLNLALIEAPRACIEYVVVHELCHLRYHGHGRGFYRLLEAVLPDWRARKRALEASFR